MNRLVINCTFLILALLLSACGREADYAKVIPVDAKIVFTLDCQRILDESGLSATSENEKVQQFTKSIKKNLTASETELFNLILTNPTELGVDWSKKVYGFIQSNTNIAALVLPVTDAETLKSTFLSYVGKRVRGHQFVDEEGFSWASGRHFDVAVANQVCVFILTPGNEKPATLKHRVATWLNQKENESFISTKYHDQLLDLHGEVGFYASITSLPENMSMMSSVVHSEDMDVSSIKYLADVSFEEGQIVAKGKILYEDAIMRDWLVKQEKACKNLKAKSLAYLPKTTPLWFGIGLDGNELFQLLLNHPTYGKQLQRMSLPLDLEGVIRSIDGDVSITYPSGIFVDVKNDEILRVCVGAISTMGRFLGLDLNEVHDNQYQLVDQNHRVSNWLNKNVELTMGMNDDSFYLLTEQPVLDKLPNDSSLLSMPWAEEVDNNLLFLAFNFQEGDDIINVYSPSRKISRSVQSYFSYASYSQKDIENNTIVLALKDQKRNVLEQLLEWYFIHFR